MLGWDVKARRFGSGADIVALQGLEGQLTVADADLVEFAVDFGRIVRQSPGAVLRASNAKDVALALRFCTEHRIPVVARAFGQSGHGQAQGAGALIIDVRGLDAIEEISADRVTVGTAVTWRAVLHAAADKGLALPVYTNHIGVSIGGSISVGGVGIASHRFGLQADNVLELEVATTKGEVVRCSRTQQSDLFHATLAGLGQFGFITKVSMRPIPAPTRVEMLRVVYQDVPALLAEAMMFAKQNRFDTVDNRIGVPPDGSGHLRANDLGLFLYGDEPAPDLRSLATQTKGHVLPQQSFDYRAYMQRDDEYVHLVGTVLGDMPKPWCVFIIPDKHVETFVTEQLEPLLSPQRGGVAFFAQPYPVRPSISTSFPLPDGNDAWYSIVGVVRVVPPPAVSGAVQEHRAMFERARALGGSVYPYGSIPLSPDDWRGIFGSRWDGYQARKRTYDPACILNGSYRITSPG